MKFEFKLEFLGFKSFHEIFSKFLTSGMVLMKKLQQKIYKQTVNKKNVHENNHLVKVQIL